jgi:hypothetical protein
MSDNYFIELNNINVNDKKEPKGKLMYLSWVWAWGELKKLHPDATYTIYENKDGLFYHTDGKTAWVKTGVTVNGIEHIEYLPVMDNRNDSIPLEKVTSTNVNKTIQRSITKAIARHGLGLYIYAGEDLPEEETAAKNHDNEVISEKDQMVLKNMCEKRGLKVENVFPNGLTLTNAQFTKAVKELEKVKATS